MTQARRAPTTVLGCSPLTFFLLIVLGTTSIAFFKSLLPGPYYNDPVASPTVPSAPHPNNATSKNESTTTPLSPPKGGPAGAKTPSEVPKSEVGLPEVFGGPKITYEDPDLWDNAGRDEQRDLPKSLPLSIFGSSGPPRYFTDTQFILHFNHRRFERIREWRQRLHFPEHVVTTAALDSDQHWPAGDPGIMDCAYPAEGGMMAYYCVLEVMEDPRFLPFKDVPLGYFFWHFDVIPNYNVWGSINYTHFISPTVELTYQWENAALPKDNWPWWPGEWGVPALINNYKDPEWDAYVNTSRWVQQGKGTDFKLKTKGFADFYYVPSGLAEEFKVQSRIMRKHKVFAEIATAMQCHLFVDRCTQIQGDNFPGHATCSVQEHPAYSFIHRATWNNNADRAWFDKWHIQPRTWLPGVQPKMAYTTRPPCHTPLPFTD